MEETALIRDRINNFRATMKNQTPVAHAKQEVPEAPEEPEEEGETAMRHDMTRKEEQDILQWFEENPEFKEDASIMYDKKLLEEGRPIGGKNVTLGSHIFDNLIGGHQARNAGRDFMNVQICGKH
eukprot:7945427-Heterocapsa_arctica.AAC.1